MVNFFEGLYNVYNSTALFLITIAFFFMLYLKMKNKNNKDSKMNYNAILIVLVIAWLFAFYALYGVKSSRKKGLGVIDAIGLL